MFQAIQVETQSEQQGLTDLHAPRTARPAGRELALHRREEIFDQCTAAIEASRECPSAIPQMFMVVTRISTDPLFSKLCQE
jgi:hypothetical protein